MKHTYLSGRTDDAQDILSIVCFKEANKKCLAMEQVHKGNAKYLISGVALFLQIKGPDQNVQKKCK